MSGFPVLSHFTSLSPKSYIVIISGIFRYFHLILKLLLEFPFSSHFPVFTEFFINLPVIFFKNTVLPVNEHDIMPEFKII